jgi:hypothetical protein
MSDILTRLNLALIQLISPPILTPSYSPAICLYTHKENYFQTLGLSIEFLSPCPPKLPAPGSTDHNLFLLHPRKFNR